MTDPTCSRSVARDWLILSLKNSTDDLLVWYRTACSGYTDNLMYAGRYTEAEAKESNDGEVTMAVRLDTALNLDPIVRRLTSLLIPFGGEQAETVKARAVRMVKGQT